MPSAESADTDARGEVDDRGPSKTRSTTPPELLLQVLWLEAKATTHIDDCDLGETPNHA
jgi:hypothetical protein